MNKSWLFGVMALALSVVSSTLVVVSAAETPGDETLKDLRLPRLTPRPVSVPGINAFFFFRADLKVNLNGKWHFNPAPPDGFWKADAPIGNGWADIQVPGEWVMQGFTVAKNTAAGYRRQFTVPAGWKGQRIKLRCDAVYSDAKIWLNGSEAGQHSGGFTPFELDVTNLVQPGRNNTIALAVKNESISDVLADGTQYAAHQLGGIPRKIYLFAVPGVNIASLHVETTFDKDYRNATLRVMLDIANESGNDVDNAQVRLKLKGPGKKSVKIAPKIIKLPPIKAGETLSHIIKIAVWVPKKWDSEHPNLYVLTCSLKTAGKELETVRQRFGFRQVEVRGNEVFVNNKPIKLRGVCRHEVHPLRGRSLTPELWKKDAELFRNANINYIRTSHYPPAEEFIEACDELGLFVEEEAPLCWLGHSANPTWRERNCHDPKYLPDILRPMLEMLQRDRSHPSIIIWSLANESFWGPNWEKARQIANTVDPNRPKCFHDQAWGDWNNYGSDLPIGNFHYPGPGGPARVAQGNRPVLFGEYCHLNTYNRQELVTDPGVRDYWGRDFAAMWEKMYASRGCLGGAIWSGIDDIFDLPSGGSVGYGAWGPIDGWRRTKPEYWHVKKTYSPIRVLAETLAVPAAGEPVRLKIANRHDFTNLSEVRIEWTLGNETGTAEADIPPRSSGTISIRPKSTELDGKKLLLKFFSRRGFLIDVYEVPIGESAATVAKFDTPATGKVDLIEDGETITVKGRGFAWVFDRRTGQIRKGEIAGQTVLVGGPVLMVLPLKSGVCATTHSADIQPFNDTCPNWKAGEVKARQTADGVEIQVKGQYKEASGTYRMGIDGTGRLVVDYRFTYECEVNPRQVGIVFDFPKVCDTLAWKRKAQWSVYPEHHIGRPTGQAKIFRDANWPEIELRTEPPWPWSLDSNALGTNDFRSSKCNIHYASLTAENGAGIKVQSDSSQTVRAYVESDSIRLLVAGYSNGGGEGFFSSHTQKEHRPLKKGSVLEDTVRLELVRPSM